MLISLYSLIGMLIMRIYALYERSRKVLALYMVLSVVILVMACVSLNFMGIGIHPDI